MTEPIPITPRTVAAIISIVQTIRPEWTEAGVRHAITRMLDTMTIDAVLPIAINGAKDPVIRTPAAVALPGPHWNTRSAAVGNNQPPAVDAFIQEIRERRGKIPPETITQGAAAARTAIREAKT